MNKVNHLGKLVPVVKAEDQDHFLFRPICYCDSNADAVKNTMQMLQSGRPHCGVCGMEMKIVGQLIK